MCNSALRAVNSQHAFVHCSEVLDNFFVNPRPSLCGSMYVKVLGLHVLKAVDGFYRAMSISMIISDYEGTVLRTQAIQSIERSGSMAVRFEL